MLISRQIKYARERAGLSQRELSRRMNLPQSYLSKVETGKLDIGSHNLQRLADALDLVPMLIAKRYVPTLRALEAQEDLSQPLWQPDETETTDA